MGKGRDMAREFDIQTGGSGIHADVLDDFKDQLMIVFLLELKRLGHSLDFPVAQVDATGSHLVSFNVVNRTFHFEVTKKS